MDESFGFYMRLGKVMEKSLPLWPFDDVEKFKDELDKIYEEVQTKAFPQRKELIDILKSIKT